jgi:hypothetical protein
MSLQRSLVTRGLATAAGLTALALAKENYEGNELNRRPAMQNAAFQSYHDSFVYNNTLRTGNKTIDSLAMRWYNFMSNITTNINEWRLHSAGITRDLIMENWHLLIAGGIGLGVGMGDWLGSGARLAGSALRQPAAYVWGGVSRYFASSTALEEGARAFGNGLVGVCRVIGRNPAASMVAAATAGFFALRFNNVATGRTDADSFTKMVQFGAGGDQYGNPFGK